MTDDRIHVLPFDLVSRSAETHVAGTAVPRILSHSSALLSSNTIRTSLLHMYHMDSINSNTRVSSTAKETFEMSEMSEIFEMSEMLETCDGPSGASGSRHPSMIDDVSHQGQDQVGVVMVHHRVVSPMVPRVTTVDSHRQAMVPHRSTIDLDR